MCMSCWSQARQRLERGEHKATLYMGCSHFSSAASCQLDDRSVFPPPINIPDRTGLL